MVRLSEEETDISARCVMTASNVGDVAETSVCDVGTRASAGNVMAWSG